MVDDSGDATLMPILRFRRVTLRSGPDGSRNPNSSGKIARDDTPLGIGNI